MAAKTIKDILWDIQAGHIEVGDEIPDLYGARLNCTEGGEITVYQAIYQVATLCDGVKNERDDFDTMREAEAFFSDEVERCKALLKAGKLKEFAAYLEEGTAHGELFINEDGELDIDWENQNLETVDYYRSSEAWDDEIVEFEGVIG